MWSHWTDSMHPSPNDLAIDLDQLYKAQELDQFYKAKKLDQLYKARELDQFYKAKKFEKFYKTMELDQLYKTKKLYHLYRTKELDQFDETKNIDKCYTTKELNHVCNYGAQDTELSNGMEVTDEDFNNNCTEDAPLHSPFDDENGEMLYLQMLYFLDSNTRKYAFDEADAHDRRRETMVVDQPENTPRVSTPVVCITSIVWNTSILI